MKVLVNGKQSKIDMICKTVKCASGFKIGRCDSGFKIDGKDVYLDNLDAPQEEDASEQKSTMKVTLDGKPATIYCSGIVTIQTDSEQ